MKKESWAKNPISPPVRWGLVRFYVGWPAAFSRSSSCSSAGPQLQALDRSVPRRSSTTKHLRRYTIECQKECQKICQKVCRNRCQIECQIECQSICQKECQIECQNKYALHIHIYMPYILPDGMSEDVRSYVRTMFHGGDHSKKVALERYNKGWSRYINNGGSMRTLQGVAHLDTLFRESNFPTGRPEWWTCQGPGGNGLSPELFKLVNHIGISIDWGTPHPPHH